MHDQLFLNFDIDMSDAIPPQLGRLDTDLQRVWLAAAPGEQSAFQTVCAEAATSSGQTPAPAQTENNKSK